MVTPGGPVDQPKRQFYRSFWHILNFCLLLCLLGCWLVLVLSVGSCLRCWGAVGLVLGGPGGVAQGGLKRPEEVAPAKRGPRASQEAEESESRGRRASQEAEEGGPRGRRASQEAEEGGPRASQEAEDGFNIAPVASFSVNCCVLGGLDQQKCRFYLSKMQPLKFAY